MGRPFYAHYVTSKAAVVGMTRALANELGGDGVRDQRGDARVDQDRDPARHGDAGAGPRESSRARRSSAR
jgi:hypothetical protein